MWKEKAKESDNNDKEQKPTLKKEYISFKVFFIIIFLILILSYKTGIRGYRILKPLDWEELLYSLPTIFLFAIIASVALYAFHSYTQKNKE